MKRPEGFDPPGPAKPATGNSTARKPAAPKPKPRVEGSAAPPRPKTPRPAPEPRAPRPERSPRGASSRGVRPDASARAELRAAARERRRFERAEVRRFTRHARNRRVGIATVVGVVVTLAILVLVAVYSPILALRHVTVDGTARIDAAELTAAVDDQLGIPLALIDYGKITEQLGAFPLIRSYVTEIVPPDTLLVHITERQPVGTILKGSTFELVDPAGITLQESPERIPGVPIIDIGGAGTSSAAFASMVEVLLALPPDLLVQVDRISASTQDDVSLALVGVGQSVTWGSASESDRKATLLAALIKLTDPGRAGVFDVSAPGNGVFRPA